MDYDSKPWFFMFFFGGDSLLLVEEIMHCKWWDKIPINWCRISSINGTITLTNMSCHGMSQGFWSLLNCFNVRDSSFSLCLGQCHHDHQVQTESEPLWNSAAIDYPCLIWRLLVDKCCRPKHFQNSLFRWICVCQPKYRVALFSCSEMKNDILYLMVPIPLLETYSWWFRFPAKKHLGWIYPISPIVR